VADLIYVAPLRYDKDIQLECWPPKATRSEDGRLLKFRLKTGHPLVRRGGTDAEDVEFTYKLMIDPKTPTAYAEDFQAVSSFAVTGKYTFEVRYDEPFARAWSPGPTPSCPNTPEGPGYHEHEIQPRASGGRSIQAFRLGAGAAHRA
jgi:hypothetical protein